MPILVKTCRTGPIYGPKDRPSMEEWTIYPGHCFVRQQHTLGYFGPFPPPLNPKIRSFDPKSSHLVRLSLET